MAYGTSLRKEEITFWAFNKELLTVVKLTLVALMLVDIIRGDPKLSLNRCNATYLPYLQQPLLENLGKNRNIGKNHLIAPTACTKGSSKNPSRLWFWLKGVGGFPTAYKINLSNVLFLKRLVICYCYSLLEI